MRVFHRLALVLILWSSTAAMAGVPHWVISGPAVVRDTASDAGAAVVTLMIGDRVEVASESGNWVRVEWSTVTVGYADRKSLSPEDGDACQARVTGTDGLKVQASPKPDGKVVTTMPLNAACAVTDEVTTPTGPWYRIEYPQRGSGWMKKADLVADESELIKQSTTTQQKKLHVVFREVIKSTDQASWTTTYNATVELFVDGKLAGTFKGSTLPNAVALAKPVEWRYSLVRATCSFPGAATQPRFYTWSRGKRFDGQRPCLRLPSRVPTVNISDERLKDLSVGQVSLLCRKRNLQKQFRFAEAILVHAGYSVGSRGSAGCLTIAPADADRFFNAIPEGATGTLALSRGIHDEQAQQSYCY